MTQGNIQLVDILRDKGIKKEEVLNAILSIPREKFVPEDYQEYAYDDRALPIGLGQTISQPFTVARMIELLDLQENQKVLEVGAGSGYNAAIMSQIIGNGRIYTLEIKKKLSELAQKNLENLDIDNVEIIEKNAHYGHIEAAPYERIIITAAITDFPEALISQLRSGGVLVAPVTKGRYEVMVKGVKENDGRLTLSEHGFYSFVPFI